MATCRRLILSSKFQKYDGWGIPKKGDHLIFLPRAIVSE
jgi:hypothetical protein